VSDLAQPFFGGVFLLITGRCNLSCSHCYVSSSPHGSFGLDDAQLRSLRDEIVRFPGILNVSISGGEPLARRDLSVELLASFSRVHRTSLLTNAMLIDRRTAKTLAACPIHIRVSLEGGQRTHDRLRGGPAYQKTVSGIDILLSEGFPSNRLSLHCAVLPGGEAAIDEVLEFADSRNIGLVRFDEIRPLGRGKANWGSLNGNASPGWLGQSLGNGRGGWFAGHLEDSDGETLSHINIFPDGGVYISAIPHPHDCIGNVGSQTLSEICADWHRIQNAIRHRFVVQSRGTTSPAYLLRRSTHTLKGVTNAGRQDR
jgi:pyruvate-formate lyase-activating enzyme